MVYNALDVSLLLQVTNGNTGETAVDFQSLDEDGLGDESEGGDLLHDAVESGLVTRNGVDGFVFDLSLGPFFLLRRLSS